MVNYLLDMLFLFILAIDPTADQGSTVVHAVQQVGRVPGSRARLPSHFLPEACQC